MKKYNSEFKSLIAELDKIGHSVNDISHEYGMSEVMIYKRIKQISPIVSIVDTEITLKQIKHTNQEMLHLQEENELLLESLAL